MSNDLHAPTLRRVIEMLDSERDFARKMLDLIPHQKREWNRVLLRLATFRERLERLEREAEKAGE